MEDVDPGYIKNAEHPSDGSSISSFSHLQMRE